jgi:hypothetical protein
MKFTLIATSAALGLMTGLTTVLAAADVIVSTTSPALLTRDQKATNACFNAFIGDLFPGRSARVRTVTPANGVDVFPSSDSGSLLAPFKVMEVVMTANLTHGHALLAKSVCRVNGDAKVLRVSTQVTDPAKLVGLTVKDLSLAMSNR